MYMDRTRLEVDFKINWVENKPYIFLHTKRPDEEIAKKRSILCKSQLSSFQEILAIQLTVLNM